MPPPNLLPRRSFAGLGGNLIVRLNVGRAL